MRYMEIAGTRASGKTRTLILKCIDHALVNPGSKILFVTNTRLQQAYISKVIQQITPGTISSVRDNKIYFTNHSTIQFASNNFTKGTHVNVFAGDEVHKDLAQAVGITCGAEHIWITKNYDD